MMTSEQRMKTIEKNQKEMKEQIERVQQEFMRFQNETRQEVLKAQMDMQRQLKVMLELLVGKKDLEDHMTRETDNKKVDTIKIDTPESSKKETIDKRKTVVKPEGAKKKVIFTPLPITYTKLYPLLLTAGLIEPRQAKATLPINGKLPFWYDKRAQCDYHLGKVGHALENCLGLKYRVQELIDDGSLQLNMLEQINVNVNPLPPHKKTVDAFTKEMIELEKEFEMMKSHKD